MGARTLLLTQKKSTIGVMSCNPSFGGVGKGALVTEIDALDGLMGRLADKAGIHYRVLNSSKGPAVHGLRCQADRKIYQRLMMEELNATPNLQIMEGSAEDISLAPSTNHIQGVVLEDGSLIPTKSVVLTTGTFLSAVIHLGEERTEAGRYGDAASKGLSGTLRRMNFELGRLKTGTPPRLNAHSIDYSTLTEQPVYSLIQIRCWGTKTSHETTAIVQNSMHLSPNFESGEKEFGQGPRYCPSLEVKVNRFPTRTHHIWLEPEGLDSDLVYPNGISMSLPREEQVKVVQSIEGCENAVIEQYGYAVEYDYVDPRELQLSLETKKIPGLFFAGQINGTTGYEEAGAQGLIAGANAAIRTTRQGDDPFIMSRSEGYTGVLIDDLVTRGTNEPYRMFTSRAEFRLSLRQDNADARLTEKGYQLGLDRYNALLEKREQVKELSDKMQSVEKKSREWIAEIPKLTLRHASTANYPHTALDLLSRVELDFADFEPFVPGLDEYPDAVKRYLRSEKMYAPQMERQSKQIEAVKRDEGLLIPSDTDYTTLGYLSTEEKQKLMKFRPQTLGQASRIQGMTPASLFFLHKICRKHAPPDHLLEDNDIIGEM